MIADRRTFRRDVGTRRIISRDSRSMRSSSARMDASHVSNSSTTVADFQFRLSKSNATSELSTYGLKEPFGRAARPHGHSTFATARARRDSDGSSKRSTPSTAVRPATNAASVRGSTANPLVNSAASRIESHVPISGYQVRTGTRPRQSG